MCAAEPPRVGLFGGAFAPVHLGHLQLARAAIDALKLDRLLWLPTARPAHRDTPAVAFERRAHWVQLAIADEPRMALDGREAERQGPSYSVDTVAELQRESAPARWYLVIGADAFEGFHRWHRWRALAAACVIAVGSRPGAADPSRTVAGRALPAAHDQPPGWRAFDARSAAISSSQVRARLECGQSIDDLVPTRVQQAIRPEERALMGQQEHRNA